VAFFAVFLPVWGFAVDVPALVVRFRVVVLLAFPAGDFVLAISS